MDLDKINFESLSRTNDLDTTLAEPRARPSPTLAPHKTDEIYQTR